MVGSNHKESILIPRHSLSFLKEFAKSIICIAYALMDFYTLFRINLFIFLRHNIRMMRRSCEESCHKRLFHLTHFGSIELHERLVPYSPCAIEILVAIKSLVGIILRASEIVGKACGTSKSLEAHRTILCTMEEG